MKISSQKSSLSGHVSVPGSKSHTIRALILATLADGTSHIKNPLPSNDCLSTVQAVKQIGAEVIVPEASDNKSSQPAVWTVRGAGKNLHLPKDVIDVGNSGSLMYFLCPVLSTLAGDCTFTGDESICKRPVNHLIDALNQLGGNAACLQPGSVTPPFKFAGPIDVNKTLTTDGKLSQYISGFMMATSRLKGTLHINLTDPKETPYLTMTKMWLESVGVPCTISEDFKKITVTGPVDIKAFDKTVPSDWEAVAFPLVAALISGSEIVIEEIDGSGSQGDDKIVEVLQQIGADIEWNKKDCTLTVRGKQGGKVLSTKNCPNGQFRVTISPFPDAICALAVIACFIEGTTIITDVEICRKKETDRIEAMKTELRKLGADVEEGEDCLIIHGHEGGKGLHGGEVESFKDHRIAMSLACLGLGLPAGESVIINDAECCSVSFPGFFEVMNSIGAGFKVL
ncbi:3-phosphoshikimate 1-carboxyvinyltransferase [Treponema sp. C6A8]|uniref:3-phosphoshikimate 1-carboxyvinyltransferase n=1 Tax=Treponema sp. C6A8 TaxID=1410609 RepID=UPI000480F220